MRPAEKIAIVDWTHLIEDYLDNIKVTFEQFRDEITGGWLFSYIKALQSANYDPIFFCFSDRDSWVGAHTHLPTGAEICVLRSPAIYRRLRKTIQNPYAEDVDRASAGMNLVNRQLRSLQFHAAEYLSTPIMSLKKELSGRSINKIICQEYESGRFDVITLMAKLTGRKSYATFQGGLPPTGIAKKIVRRLCIGLADGLISGSNDEIARIKTEYGLSSNRAARIFNPVHFENQKPFDKAAVRRKFGIAADAKVAVWHGRIDFTRKGFDVLVRAWQKYCEKPVGFERRLMLLGYGNEADKLKEHLASVQNQTIEWIPEFYNDREKIREFLSLGDVYVFASRHEGFPNAPLEAMSLRLPLISTKVSGIVEALENDKECGGILVEQEDSSGLANAIETLFANDSLRSELSLNAQKRIKSDFSIETVGKQLKEFLEHR